MATSIIFKCIKQNNKSSAILQWFLTVNESRNIVVNTVCLTAALNAYRETA